MVCGAMPEGLNPTDANVYGHVVDKHTREPTRTPGWNPNPSAKQDAPVASNNFVSSTFTMAGGWNRFRRI